MAFGDGRIFTTEVPNFRLGRKADACDRTSNFRLWLQAEVRARLVNVRSSTDNGHCCDEVRFHRD